MATVLTVMTLSVQMEHRTKQVILAIKVVYSLHE